MIDPAIWASYFVHPGIEVIVCLLTNKCMDNKKLQHMYKLMNDCVEKHEPNANSVQEYLDNADR